MRIGYSMTIILFIDIFYLLVIMSSTDPTDMESYKTANVFFIILNFLCGIYIIRLFIGAGKSLLNGGEVVKDNKKIITLLGNSKVENEDAIRENFDSLDPTEKEQKLMHKKSSSLMRYIVVIIIVIVIVFSLIFS